MIDSTLIEKYFSNKLTDAELKMFNALYSSDIEFKNEVNFLKNIKAVSEKEDTTEFKNKLNTYESELSSKNKILYAKWVKPLVAIAAIFLIAFCVQFFWNIEINEEALFSNYFEPSKNVSAPIVRSENEQSATTSAFIVYSKKDYENALVLFEKAYASNKNSELLFYEGNALLALGKTNEAITKFKQHLTFLDILTNRSHWYLALAYLKNKDLELSKNELKALIDSGESFKTKEAKSLLKKLD
jgi:tetratricopeptide (TPR) repeat protein